MAAEDGYMELQNDIAEKLGDGSVDAILNTMNRYILYDAGAREQGNGGWGFRDAFLEYAIHHNFAFAESVEKMEFLKELAIILCDECDEGLETDELLCLSRRTKLSTILGHQYTQSGECKHLIDAVSEIEKAVSLSPRAQRTLTTRTGGVMMVHRPATVLNALDTLASRLDEYFQLTGALGVLDRCVSIREALAGLVLEPAQECQRAQIELLINAADSLHRRYEQSDEANNYLDRAYRYAQKAVQLSENEQDRLSGALAKSSLAEVLGRQALDNNNMDELDEAIQLSRSDPSRLMENGVNLTLRILQKYDMRRKVPGNIDEQSLLEGIDEAIMIAESTVSGMPDDHPIRPHLNNLLGHCYYARYQQTRFEQPDPTVALGYLWTALNSNKYTSLFRRIQAGRQIVRICCDASMWSAAYEAAIAIVALIPKLSPRAIQISDKQRILSADDIVGFGADAVALAIEAGKGGYAALSLVESARGSLAASISNLRVDILALDAVHPGLARLFAEARNELQQASSTSASSANEKFDKLLEEIRCLEGFGGFCQPLTEEATREAARSGPIVVLSASEYGDTRAILVKSQSIDVMQFPLVTLHKLEHKDQDMQNTEFLKWLWFELIKPILEALGYTEPQEVQPRIWWIPIGVFSRVPLHAAGDHSLDSTENVMDWVVSSYSLSIKAILNARRAAVGSHPLVLGKGEALLVGMARTPRLSVLSAVTEEMSNVERLLRDMGLDCTLLQNAQAQKQSVLEHLQTSQVFHFAGHGGEKEHNPLKSALLLEDWEMDPMTVGGVMGLDLHKKSPFLAYLSACATGQITTSKFRDESIHLISAYQLAGFRHVIGTLREVNDAASLAMATATYKNLQSGGITDESVSRSLHQAAKQLRHMARDRASNRASAGGRDIVLHEEVVLEGEENWIPFVHFGI
ncbi:unnamed protein product [Clonostachys solani]|uniref:CHAT domain-containing protein n=1 Tax=Clonostachys solani TaxID=160281 RepID=A0A9N9W6U9_9HYPO|nr:unnamed protein product [Clonostachys solani]